MANRLLWESGLLFPPAIHHLSEEEMPQIIEILAIHVYFTVSKTEISVNICYSCQEKKNEAETMGWEESTQMKVFLCWE